ncbi:hypothetical protein NEOLEDRAFT_1130828 [Neolentinus lepideus HHB14362 ss-1]|uniref:Protein kinase domain-containing protein n=1 Tax=Neolentinus lepideus HHB14362 ss-1 TaxID=1314782 RepID=A0A165TWY5_9AGAM|nr:hypothetical protein NEOLEDRAFT_1130828 [Neolentinus lepideus HHB14362 ss-1]
MAQRRSPHRISAKSNDVHSYSKLRYASNPRGRAAGRFRQTSNSSHASSASTDSQSDRLRAVLVPLRTNLRRLPSRILAAGKEAMRDASQSLRVSVGSKRKRVASGNENSHSEERHLRGGKRLRSMSSRMDTSDEDRHSEMDVEEAEFDVSPVVSADEDAVETSDDYLINAADPRQLRRLRKDELVHLYNAAGLSGDPETLTKPEIVDAIIAVREDVAELPPTSPPLAAADNSSECSSDDGNFAAGEETDISSRYGTRANGLRRRVTVHNLSEKMSKALKGRSLSLGQLDCTAAQKATRLVNGKKSPLDVGYGSLGRRRLNHVTTASPSPTVSATSSGLPSPPITRLRTRQTSTEHHTSALSSKNSKGKGKAKHVDFSDEVEINGTAPASTATDDESELTDLAELEVSANAANPSPRRLRSKDKQDNCDVKSKSEPKIDRLAPSRKSQFNRRNRTKSENLQEGEGVSDAEENDEEEVDELISSASPTPTPPPAVRRTPVKRRLRPRRVQTHTPPTDSDDAHEGDDEEEEDLEDTETEGVDEENMDAEGDVDDEGTVVAEPLKLRSGKVVGDGEAAAAEEDIEESDEEEDEEYVDAEMQEGEPDAEGETEESEESDEPMEDDVDLTVVTAKALVRLRRDDLVKMCESRDIEPTGTKPQLAEALLQWRDRQSEFSSPSSAGTARPPSTARPRRRKTRSSTNDRDVTPVLLRSNRVHVEQPQTPPVSQKNKKEPEPELELDLESLGLEDREIPPDKLTKLEKIGSGGFKDVYVGKFKGRRVAIAEFRGQLSAMDIKELKLLGDFNHPNIVKFLGVSIPENTREIPVMIVSELCSNGDLFDYVRNVAAPSLYRALSMMLDIARGLEYLHTRKPSIIHRDCKSSNILITSRGVAKITDFGLAKVKQSTRSMVRSLVGTVNWQAPELWHAHPKYNHKVDVFSLAMVFWEMLQWHIPNKKFPWEGMNEHAIYEIVGAKRQRPSISGLRKQWCPEIVDLMERMWIHDPQERPTMIEVVQQLEQLQIRYR